MIGRDTNKATFAATGVLSLGLFLPASLSGTHAGTLTVDGTASAYVTRAKTVAELLQQRGISIGPQDRVQPEITVSLRDTNAVTIRHAVSVDFSHGGTIETVATTSATVAEFLAEREIKPGENDYISPAPQSELQAGTTIEYRPALTVSLQMGKTRRTITTAEPSVGTLLYAQGITLGEHDYALPAVQTPLSDNLQIRVVRVVAWTKHEHQKIVAEVERRLDFTLSPGAQKVIAKGLDGERERIVQFVQQDGARTVKRVLVSRVVRPPKSKIIAQGISEYEAFAALAERGIKGTLTLARNAMSMIATAYTAGCTGCSGITASGRPAGHGIVAVDPRVIPLGTKLYIPGYGAAVAGDTGGAIIGNRIDLGFNSYGDAIRFGRRAINVYVLR